MIKLFPILMNKLFIHKYMINIPKYFCSQFSINLSRQHIVQTTLRNHRRLYLNGCVLNKTKDISYAQLRKHNQGMIALKQLGKCPGVIQRLSEKQQDQIDIVLEGKKMRKLSKSQTFPLTPLYIRVNGQQHRCIFYKYDFHQDGFIQKAYLKEYIPGEPNHLRVPIKLTHLTNNRYIMNKSQTRTPVEYINIICYNEQYPLKFNVDVSYCSPYRSYRVGDLANTFPPGIILEPKVNVNDIILQVGEIPEIVEEDQNDLQEQLQGSEQKDKAKKDQKPASGATGGTPASEAGKGGKEPAGKGGAKKAETAPPAKAGGAGSAKGGKSKK